MSPPHPVMLSHTWEGVLLTSAGARWVLVEKLGARGELLLGRARAQGFVPPMCLQDLEEEEEEIESWD